MTRLVHILLPPLQWCVRALRVRSERVPPVQRLILAILMIPPFALLWALLRLHGLLRGPIEVHCAARGVQFTCRLPDMIQTYVHLFGIWEPDVTAFICRRLSPGDAFIDVGANTGYFAMLASRIVCDTGRVVAIEACPRIHSQLQDTIAMNGSPANIRVVNKAAGRERGMLNLYRGPTHNTGLTSTVQHRGMQLDATVEAAPLGELLTNDEIAAARIIKIDVEGGEDAVLAGMIEVVEKLRDDVEIAIELSPTWWAGESSTALPRDVLRPFVERGFNVYELDNNYWPWRYLWADDVRPPRRVRRELTARVSRIDLVLSRIDAEEL